MRGGALGRAVRVAVVEREAVHKAQALAVRGHRARRALLDLQAGRGADARSGERGRSDGEEGEEGWEGMREPVWSVLLQPGLIPFIPSRRE
jgi:hypothetical protein